LRNTKMMDLKKSWQDQSKKINQLFKEEKWIEAKAYIFDLLKEDPCSHWLLTRLSTTYYEEKEYDRALEYAEQTLKIAPHCPLVLWDYAGALDMLNRFSDAISIYKSLIRRGINRIAYDECGEGIRWARVFINDCRYRLGLAYASTGKFNLAKKYLREHISNRNGNTPSIYSLREVKKDLTLVLKGIDPRSQ
jgi:tetratricopeptide (TPR) repeat protein